jgi:hypothetical protein
MPTDHRPPLRGMPARVDSSRLDLAAEFRDHPFGRHSPDLQALLDYMRGGPVPGSYFLWMIEPHAKWVLARFTDSEPLRAERLDDFVFDDIIAAEWFVFRARWKEIFGVELEDS